MFPCPRPAGGRLLLFKRTCWQQCRIKLSELFCQGANDLSYIVVRSYPIIIGTVKLAVRVQTFVKTCSLRDRNVRS